MSARKDLNIARELNQLSSAEPADSQEQPRRWESFDLTFAARRVEIRSRSAIITILPESRMRAIFVVLGNVLAEKSFQTTLIESEEVIQQLTAAATHPTFRDTIVPGIGCKRGFELTRFIGPIGV